MTIKKKKDHKKKAVLHPAGLVLLCLKISPQHNLKDSQLYSNTKMNKWARETDHCLRVLTALTENPAQFPTPT